MKPTGVSYNGEIDIPSPPLSAANVWPVLISVHQRAHTYVLTLACRQSLRAFPNQHHRRETNDETMKQLVVTIGEPKSMCEGEKQSKKKKKEEYENPMVTKERYLLAAQSSFLQAWFSVVTG